MLFRAILVDDEACMLDLDQISGQGKAAELAVRSRQS